MLRVLGRSIFSFVLLFVAWSVLATNSFGGPQVPQARLEAKYAAPLAKAKTIVENPERLSGVERFRLAYIENPNELWEDRIARLLLVARSQEAVIENFIQKGFYEPVLGRPGNVMIATAGLNLAKTLMYLDCSSPCGKEKAELHRKAVREYFKIFDLRDVHDGFSGLPFYGLVQARVRETAFQKSVVELEQKIAAYVVDLSQETPKLSEATLFDLAQQVTGSPQKSIELLGILTSRDVLITRYLRYLPRNNPQFLQAFARIPVLIRLASSLDAEARGLDLERFAHPQGVQITDARNYYFWSSALAAQQLRNLGYPEETIRDVSKSFPKQYKRLRYIEGGGPFQKTAHYRMPYRQDVDLTQSLTAAGSDFIHSFTNDTPDLNARKTVEGEKFRRWVQKLDEEYDYVAAQKSELLGKIADNDPDLINKGYLLYYNLESNVIGYPHLKMILGGRVYEIHRSPTESGGFLRDRDLTTALKDARSGYLPSAILEFDLTPEQADNVLRFLEIEAAGTMKYAFFHRLFASDTYNCGGILYEALRFAGLGLPALKPTDALVGQMIRIVSKKLAGSRWIGTGKNWAEELVRPNWTLESIPKPLGRSRSAGIKLFMTHWNGNFLYAEQQLVTRLPKGAEPIGEFGRFVPYYSNNGKLPAQFTPGSSGAFYLKTLLIPESELQMSWAAGATQDPRTVVVDSRGKRLIRFFIHPNELQHYKALIERYPSEGERFLATPTSSARSLAVMDSKGEFKPMFIKTSLSVEMGGAARILNEERVFRAIEVSEMFRTAHRDSGGKLESGKSWNFFDEPVSAIPKGEQAALGGYILRNAPDELSQQVFLPTFALIAKRKFESTWIEEIYKSSPYKNRLDFVFNELVRPLVELHIKLSMDYGLTTEMHQQNVVYAINPDTLEIQSVFLRDMDAHYIDHSLRKNILGFNDPIRRSTELDAIHFRFADASANQFHSYADLLRNRNIIRTYQSFLSPSELKTLVEKSDQLIMNAFNRRFPNLAISQISEYKAAWQKAARIYTTSQEETLYGKIREMFSSPKNSQGFFAWLQDLYKRAAEMNIGRDLAVRSSDLAFLAMKDIKQRCIEIIRGPARSK